MLRLIASDAPLGPERKDHALKGSWMPYRECHVGGDFLLVQRINETNGPSGSVYFGGSSTLESMLRTGSRRRGWVVSLAASMIFMIATGSSLAAGPEVGETVPVFEAVDQSGETRDFDSLAGEQGLLLLFFRSADW